MSRAVLTNKTRLLIKPYGFEGFTDFNIKSYPEILGKIEEIESTNLTDEQIKYRRGIKSSSGKEFTLNFTASAYFRLLQHEMEPGVSFMLSFGEYGEQGVWEAFGSYAINPNEGEVDAVREMTLTVTTKKPFKMTDSNVPHYPANNWESLTGFLFATPGKPANYHGVLIENEALRPLDILYA